MLTQPAALADSATAAEKTTYEASLKAYDKADRAASQIIVKTIESNVMALLVTCESARDVWIKLQSIYQQQTKQSSHSVQREFFNFTKNATDNMVTHIAKFEDLVLKMQQLDVKPDDSSLDAKLLDSLPDDYESLCQAWWARAEDQQTLLNLIGVLTSDETRRLKRVVKQEEIVALLASKIKAHDKIEKTISYHGKRNGSGKNYASKNQSTENTGANRKDKSKLKCHKCQGYGHFRNECPSKAKYDNSRAPKETKNYEAFICETLSCEKQDCWIADCGATDHVTHCREYFSTYEQFKVPSKIYVGDNSTMDALGKGSIKFEACNDGNWVSCTMENVLYVYNARRNLLSVITATEKGLTFVSSRNGCEFVRDGIVKARGVRDGRLYKMLIRVIEPEKSYVGEVNVAS